MTKNGESENFQIQIQAAMCCPIGHLWDHTELTGTFWRLYRNDRDGAGVILNGQRYPIRGGSFYLLPPGCDLPAWCDDPETEQLFLHFDLFFLSGTAPVLPVPPDPELDRLAQLLIRELNADSHMVPLFSLALASLALAKLPQENFSARPCDFAIVKACQYMQVNLNRELGVGDMAAFARLPVTIFVRRFREYTGSTPYRYLTDLRYECAERLLRSGNYGIDEICDRIGIKDRFHFSRCFKQRYGYSPAAYRNHAMKAAKTALAFDGK